MSGINTCLRKFKINNENICAKDVLNEDCLKNMINHNDGYKFKKNVRSSPAYWESKNKN